MKRKSAYRAAGALLAGLLVQANASAFDGLSIKVPDPQNPSIFTAKSGMRLSVTGNWFPQGGYRPVRFAFAAAAATKDNRVIDVELVFGNLARNQPVSELFDQPGVRASDRVVMPAGETEAEVVLLCPSDAQYGMVGWKVAIDGEREPKLCVSFGVGRVNQQRAAMNVLGPAPNAFQRETPRAGRLVKYRDLNGLVADEARSEFFESWQAYSAADVVVLDRDELKELSEERPRAFLALKRWALAGGALWVERVGEEVKGLIEIDKLLGAEGWRIETNKDERPESPASPDESSEEPTKRQSPQKARELEIAEAPGWRHELLVKASDDPAEAIQDLVQQGRRGGALGALNWLAGAADSKGWYATRVFGFGRVMAFRKTSLDVPLRLAPPKAGSSVAASLWAEKRWDARHGLAPGSTSSEFGNLLIPGVGIAPVIEFQVLITLFVILIGPLNYWLLWRRQQLHMLVVTAPLCALVITAGLFAYALAGDGLGVQARARSVTLLNQLTGEAVSWSRLSHYAGIAPEGGLVMPREAAIYPITPAWESAIAAPEDATREVDWSGDAMRLGASWMPSRTAVQHLAIVPRETDAKIVFSQGSGALSASNRLGAAIELLIVLDEQGELRFAESIEEGAAVELEPADYLDATQRLRVFALDNEPQFPEGAGKEIEDAMQLLGDSRGARRRQRMIGSVSLDLNLLNRQIDRLTGLDGGRALDLPPRAYVAVTTESVESPLGVEDAVESGSFHIVVGRW